MLILLRVAFGEYIHDTPRGGVVTRSAQNERCEGSLPDDFPGIIRSSQYGLNNFDAHGIEQLLQEPGREVNSSGDVSQACEYLLEKGLLKRGTHGAYGITASGIDEVESNR
jgi:hypothetical protein